MLTWNLPWGWNYNSVLGRKESGVGSEVDRDAEVRSRDGKTG